MNGIAVLPVSGTLVSRTRALQPYSGMTGYNGIIARLQQAASDPMWTAFCSIWTHRAGWWREHLTVLTSSPVCET
ncbi:peptidase, S49 family protein [Escherichia coli B94]|nr:peptidase, S49 family protein [Escherichia coli B94]